MVKGHSHGLMAVNTRDNTKITKSRGTVYILMLTGQYTKANLKTIYKMDMVESFI